MYSCFLIIKNSTSCAMCLNYIFICNQLFVYIVYYKSATSEIIITLNPVFCNIWSALNRCTWSMQSHLHIYIWHHFKLHNPHTYDWISNVIQRPKIFVYVSCIEHLWSCMYRNTRYTTFSCNVYLTLYIHVHSYNYFSHKVASTMTFLQRLKGGSSYPCWVNQGNPDLGK